MTALRHILWVGCGGFIGAIMRYLMGLWASQLWPDRVLPLGTIAANLLGCLAIGLLAGGLSGHNSPAVMLFLMVGLLGGFTTFSAFGLETLTLMREGHVAAALGNVLLQVTGGLIAVWVGWRLMTHGAS